MRNKQAKILKDTAQQIFNIMLNKSKRKIAAKQYYKLDTGQLLNASYIRLYRKMKRLYSRGLREQELINATIHNYKI